MSTLTIASNVIRLFVIYVYYYYYVFYNVRHHGGIGSAR
jgi:hypothetical protein